MYHVLLKIAVPELFNKCRTAIFMYLTDPSKPAGYQNTKGKEFTLRDPLLFFFLRQDQIQKDRHNRCHDYR